jgi:hypothetical protein
VSFVDVRGSKHTVTVAAESLYEAAAAALVEFRKSGWLETQPGPMTQLEVEVAEPTTRHSVTAQQVQRWAQSTAVTPADRVKRERVRALLLAK